MASSDFPWGMLDRRFLAEQAQNAACPEWQRVALAAWHRVNSRGVARFERGELALAAAKLDQQTGELVPLRNARRALATAKDQGWLDRESTTEEVRVSGNVYGVGTR